jgi:hypothetical protein
MVTSGATISFFGGLGVILVFRMANAIVFWMISLSITVQEVVSTFGCIPSPYIMAA